MEVNKLKKRVIGTSIIVILCIVLSACSTKPVVTQIVFPSNDFGKTEYNAYIYEIEPFTLNIEFPKDWEVVYPKENRDCFPGFSTVEVYYGEEYVCSISFNVFELYEGTTDENFYRSVYNQFMIGQEITWDNNYTPIKSDENSCSATCDVLVSSPDGEVTYPGILAYDKRVMAYIAIDFEKCKIEVPSDVLESIAESITLSRI